MHSELVCKIMVIKKNYKYFLINNACYTNGYLFIHMMKVKNMINIYSMRWPEIALILDKNNDDNFFNTCIISILNLSNSKVPTASDDYMSILIDCCMNKDNLLKNILKRTDIRKFYNNNEHYLINSIIHKLSPYNICIQQYSNKLVKYLDLSCEYIIEKRQYVASQYIDLFILSLTDLPNFDPNNNAIIYTKNYETLDILMMHPKFDPNIAIKSKCPSKWKSIIIMHPNFNINENIVYVMADLYARANR